MEEKGKKARHWTLLVYPDSCPKNWKEILQQTGCEIAISPLHDKDINDEMSDTLKKPHYHVIISYPNTTTYNNVKQLTKELNTTIPKDLKSVKGMYRYFTHMDNPDKYQYDSKEIQLINGFDDNCVTELTYAQKKEIQRQIIKYIQEKNIKYYLDLINQLAEDNLEWCNVALDNTLLFTAIIKSIKDKNFDNKKNKRVEEYDKYANC